MREKVSKYYTVSKTQQNDFSANFNKIPSSMLHSPNKIVVERDCRSRLFLRTRFLRFFAKTYFRESKICIFFLEQTIFYL